MNTFRYGAKKAFKLSLNESMNRRQLFGSADHETGRLVKDILG